MTIQTTKERRYQKELTEQQLNTPIANGDRSGSTTDLYRRVATDAIEEI